MSVFMPSILSDYKTDIILYVTIVNSSIFHFLENYFTLAKFIKTEFIKSQLFTYFIEIHRKRI